jgi:peptidoglycan/xylan/chitin deacetylase (PgdA/CDA1 family)
MKKLLFKLIRYSGLPFIFSSIIQRNKVTILLFHDIDPKYAKKIFTYLSKNYNIIDLNYFIDAYYGEIKNELPEKSLIITFDDGHSRNYELLPILKELKIPITIFLCSSIVNTKRQFWFKFKNKSLSVKTLKSKSNIERLKELRRDGFEQHLEFESPQALDLNQINEMRTYVNFQSHTMFHPILPKCTLKESDLELSSSKAELELMLDKNINTISYPNGDYSEREIALARKCGYKCGITVDYGFNSLNSDIFKLKRISVNDTINLDELIVKATGVWAFIKTLNGKVQGYGYTKIVEN